MRTQGTKGEEAMTTISTAGTAIDMSASEYVQRTLVNAQNLLRLQKGEIAYDRKRGLDPAIYDLTLAQAQSVILSEVTRVLAWEPDIRVLAARILPSTDGTDGAFIIEADVEVRT